MEHKLQYLHESLRHYRELHKNSERNSNIQKMSMSIVALLFMTLYYLEYDIAEISFLGLNLKNINHEKLFFLIPLLITFQFTYYIFNRLKGKIVAYRLYAVSKEIQHLVGIDNRQLFEQYPYISTRGTRYTFTKGDRRFSFGLKIANTVIWIPVVYVFFLSSWVGFRRALDLSDDNFLVFYTITITICIITVIFMQYVKMMAFRGSKIENQESLKKGRDNDVL